MLWLLKSIIPLCADPEGDRGFSPAPRFSKIWVLAMVIFLDHPWSGGGPPHREIFWIRAFVTSKQYTRLYWLFSISMLFEKRYNAFQNAIVRLLKGAIMQTKLMIPLKGITCITPFESRINAKGNIPFFKRRNNHS